MGNSICDTFPNSPCQHNTCVECKEGKKFIPRKGLNVMTTKKQWNAIEVPNQSKSNTNDDETYKKIAIKLKEVRVIQQGQGTPECEKNPSL